MGLFASHFEIFQNIQEFVIFIYIAYGASNFKHREFSDVLHLSPELNPLVNPALKNITQLAKLPLKDLTPLLTASQVAKSNSRESGKEIRKKQQYGQNKKFSL